ncbi:MAG: PTS sugar transporter subunit IIA [Candidatus Kapaibacterium sp.]
MKITDILEKQSIDTSLVAGSKQDLLDKMLELASKTGKVNNAKEARNEILEREKIMSTGVGRGIALPHAKTNSVEDSVGAMALLERPIEYEALDGEPVDVVFLLLGRENNVGNHLRLLSKISRLMNHDTFQSRLKQSTTPEQVMALLYEFERSESE